MQKSRNAFRKRGLRLVQIWVPDTRSKEFKAECRRQCLLLVGDTAEAETMLWWEKAADYRGWEP
ncbi:MAG: hypothetical protein A3E84_02860 [Gammaproteobacteria bacterium RIFCSPHIGHO2_12_FULL_42_13]|nr:MAG: hypothetical protein A3E84_02860 [Gammaproteobacteria bacterium RIFCSPHIGHO2_12_FULL_42_13]